MKVREEKIGVLCRLLEKQQVTETHRIEEVQYQPCGYQQDGEIPAEAIGRLQTVRSSLEKTGIFGFSSICERRSCRKIKKYF